jgi:O-Antigen ligase
LIFLLGAFLTSTFPRFTWFVLPVTCLVLIVPALRYIGWRELFKPNMLCGAFYFLICYLFLNGLWAANQLFALGSAALFSGITILILATIRAIPYIPKPILRRAGLAFVLGTFLGAIYLVLELSTQLSIMRWTLNSIDLFQRNAKHMVTVDGQVTKIKSSVLDHNAAILMFNVWPALLVLRNMQNPHRILLIALYFTSVATAVSLSEHDSSQVALVLSPLVFFLASLWPRTTARGLAATWCLAFLLVLPGVWAAYKAELYEASWLPQSARHRVIIWEYTAERVPEHFWGGIGVASTPALKPRTSEKPNGFQFARSTGEHAHDLFLQAWYELGFVGVILTAIAGAAVALKISLLPMRAIPYAAAAYFVCIAIEAFAWSVWQTWLMCAVGLSVVYLQVASNVCDDVDDDVDNE